MTCKFVSSVFTSGEGGIFLRSELLNGNGLCNSLDDVPLLFLGKTQPLHYMLLPRRHHKMMMVNSQQKVEFDMGEVRAENSLVETLVAAR